MRTFKDPVFPKVVRFPSNSDLDLRIFLGKMFGTSLMDVALQTYMLSHIRGTFEVRRRNLKQKLIVFSLKTYMFSHISGTLKTCVFSRI